MIHENTGVARITMAFAAAKRARRCALMPYLTLGYPTPQATLELVPALQRAGAGLLELGVPFSDPIADGPIIQQAGQAALAAGTTPALCLELAARLREQGVTIPFLLMGYCNPILSYGVAAYAADCRRAGVDGLIVPDLPLEEAGDLAAACRMEGLALIPLLAPNTPDARLAQIAAAAEGFLYLVSRPGTTGPRESLPEGLAEYVARARAVTSLPLALGFGISRPDQVRAASRLVDGVIVGSALVEKAGQGVEAVEAYVRELKT
jgi:tryptophan synthase alpha chain